MLHLSELHHARCSQAVPAGVSGGVPAVGVLGFPCIGRKRKLPGASVRSLHLLGQKARLGSLGMLTVGHQWVLSKEKLSLGSPQL